MTQCEIIEELYISRDLDICICKLIRIDHRQDFKHEFILNVYKIPAERLIALHKRNELKFYIVRSLINFAKSFNQYIPNTVDNIPELRQPEPIDMDARLEDERTEVRLLSYINNNLDSELNSPFYRCILEAYTKHGGMRKAARATGIHVSVISRSVKKIREHLAELL
jgi:hypothetical protein